MLSVAAYAAGAKHLPRSTEGLVNGPLLEEVRNVFVRCTEMSSALAARSIVVAVAALMILSGCAKVDSTDVADSVVSVTGSVSAAPTVEETVPSTTAPPTITPPTAPASDLSIPNGYPISLPLGGDITNVTEEIENNYGTDQLVTRLEVWYDGDRLEEFAMFYLSWIVDNGYLIADSLTNEDERRVVIRGVMPPDNDTYGLTVAVIGDSTTVSTLWSRSPG